MEEEKGEFDEINEKLEQLADKLKNIRPRLIDRVDSLEYYWLSST